MGHQMASKKWEVIPTTADVGFMAHAATIPELFMVASTALQCIRLGLEPGETLPGSNGDNIVLELKKSQRLDRDLVVWLEEINWIAESKTAAVHIQSVNYDKDVLHASGVLCNDIFLHPVIEVKAVTFHELELSEVFSDSGKVLGYRAKVILDV